MTDPNAPVPKHLNAAHEHLAAHHARREAAQALIARLQADAAQAAGETPTDPPTEA